MADDDKPAQALGLLTVLASERKWRADTPAGRRINLWITLAREIIGEPAGKPFDQDTQP